MTSSTSSARESGFHFGHPRAVDMFLSPKSVGVVSDALRPGSVGYRVLKNLLGCGFPGSLYAIQPQTSSILGIEVFPTLAAVPHTLDLAIIAAPAEEVPKIVEDGLAAGTRGAIILSSGFSETGPEGKKLEGKVFQAAQQGKIRLMGPGSLGVMIPSAGLNATIAGRMALPGKVAFVSQSGALCSAILDWSLSMKVGFSAFVSVGGLLDVGWADLIEYLGNDPKTQSIVLYMESVGNARAFLSAAREVTLSKPIIVLKAGRTAAAAQVAASHSGAFSGSDDVLDAAFRRCGVLRVTRMADLFYVSGALGTQPRPRGPRLTIVTDAGGPGVLATDALVSEGGQLAQLSEETVRALRNLLPSNCTARNPIDVSDSATSEHFVEALKIAAKDPATDGLLAILTPLGMTDPTRTAELMTQAIKTRGKPILASWMGGSDLSPGKVILSQAGIPTFSFPDTAARVFNTMWHYSANLKSLYETPLSAADDEQSAAARSHARRLLEGIRQSSRVRLNEFESRQLLRAYQIPQVKTHLAQNPREAVLIAEELGYPVVLKLSSEQFLNRHRMGGVRLNLISAKAVREAFGEIQQVVDDSSNPFRGIAVQPMVPAQGYQIRLSSLLDPQFGPLILFGAGGELGGIFRDQVLGLPPLNVTLARLLLQQTRVFEALQLALTPSEMEQLLNLVVRFSQLVAEQDWIQTIDINPLFVSGTRVLALDVHVTLHGLEVSPRSLSPLAIRPYPSQYSTSVTLGDGRSIRIRPIRPEDEPLMVRFHETLSEKSVYFRYLHPVKLSARVCHERLTRICFIDYDREMALVAQETDSKSGEHPILGVGRLVKGGQKDQGEFAVVVADQAQRCGLGTALLKQLLHVGREEKLSGITGTILPENWGMLKVCEKLGFILHHSIEEGAIQANIYL